MKSVCGMGGLRRRDGIEGGRRADASRMTAGSRSSRGRSLTGVARSLSLLRVHCSEIVEVYKIWRIIILFRYVVPSLADKGLFEACVNDNTACSRSAGKLKRNEERSGPVLFWYAKDNRRRRRISGCVLFRIAGQRCKGACRLANPLQE